MSIPNIAWGNGCIGKAFLQTGGPDLILKRGITQERWSRSNEMRVAAIGTTPQVVAASDGRQAQPSPSMA